MKKNKKKYPWQSPTSICLLFLAMLVSAYLIITMPASKKIKWQYDDTSKSMQELVVEKKSSKSVTSQNNESLDKKSQDKSKKVEISNLEKILAKIKSFTRLFLTVGIAAFLAGLMEARSWHRHFDFLLRKITKAARLPQVIGVSMPVALYSNASANAILVSSHSQGEISTSALITGGMANSYLAHFSHSMRVLYPVVALIGISGILYFFVQMFGGFMIVLIAFCINRYRCRNNNSACFDFGDPENQKKILDWISAIKLGVKRALALLFRMGYITIPLMLGMEWLIKAGTFNFWEKYVPSHVAQYFPAESISIIIAQIGGLVQSAAVSANLYSEGLVHHSQILLAMLVASAVGNPIRTLRRNLPTALGVFPPRVAFTIVFTMQIARFLVTLIGSIMVILWIKIHLFD